MNWGCIPTKLLIHQSRSFMEIKQNQNFEGPVDQITLNLKSLQENKKRCVERLVKGIEFLLEKNNICVLKGEAEFESQREIIIRGEREEQKVKANKIILATGSRPGSLPFIKVNKKEVIDSKQALDATEAPPRLIVIGAGAVGLELGALFHRLGSKVTVLEVMPQILPGSDEKTAVSLERELRKQGLEVLTEMKIEECLVEEGVVTLKGISIKKDTSFEYQAEKVLLAVGRKPNSEKLKKALPELDLDEAGFVKVNKFMETNIKDMYAVGDLAGGKLLAHKASHEGLTAAENACGARKSMNDSTVPWAVFTEPEFSSVGLTEENAKEKYGNDIRIGKFPLKACGRALTMGKGEGFVKIIADKHEKILGAHILSPSASEMISEVTLALKSGIKVSELASVIHVHPTLSESIMEAALNVQKKAIHIINLT